jgi:hypothetical protein
MRSIPLTIVWEMYTRGKWHFLGALLAGNALPALLLTALRHDGALDPEDKSIVTIQVTMVLVNALIVAVAIFHSQGAPSRLFAYPIPASVIAACHLFPAMAAMAIGCLISTVALNAVFHLGWPLWGPAMFLSVALAAFMAGVWLTDKSPWHMFVLVSSVPLVMGLWFHARYGLISYWGPPRMWRDVTATEALTMLAVAGLAYVGAVRGIARSRCGEHLKTPAFFVWLGKALDPAPAVGLAFRTPAAAQFWFEWRQKGWAMPFEVLVVLPICFSLWLLFDRVPQNLYEGVLHGGGALLTVGALIVGLMMGNAGPVDGWFETGHFAATRPMTNTDLSWTMLKTAAISVFAAWSLWAVAFLILYAIVLATGAVPQPQLPGEWGWWYFPATFVGAWLGVSLLATIGQAGRPKFFMILFFGSLTILLAGIILRSDILPQDEQSRGLVQNVLMIGASLLFILGTSWTFAAAQRRSLVALKCVYAAAAIWSGLALLVVAHAAVRAAAPFAVYFFVVGLMSLAVFPLAAAPLALSWNRHR